MFNFYVIDSSGAIKVVGSQGHQGPAGLALYNDFGIGEDNLWIPPGIQGVKGDKGDSGLTIPGLDGEDASEWPFSGIPFFYEERTITTTGNIDDLDVGSAPSVLLRMNNASLSTLRGMKPGFNNQEVWIVSIGAGQVDLSHQNAGSSAANRLINFSTGAVTSLAAGVGAAVYQYDGTTARWRLVVHEQGAVITYTPTWTASVVNPSLGNGTLSGTFFQRGRTVNVIVQLVIGSTTTLGTGDWFFTLPITFSGTQPLGSGFMTSGGGAANNGIITAISTGLIGILSSNNTNLGAASPAGITTGDVFRGAIPGYLIA